MKLSVDQITVALILFGTGSLAAQPAPVPKDGKVTIPLELSPAAARKPASRDYLYPEYRDLQPGDKLSGFLKCFAEQDVFFNGENRLKRQKWLEMPLADLPADVREQAGIKKGIAYDATYSSMMVFLDQAARYNRVEWNDWFNVRKYGVYLLIPEIQKLRVLADVLALRLRGEVKNREFDRAIASVKSLMGLADLGRTHPTLIGNLVGLATAHLALAGVEEMIQQPGCPNLFWSLTDLPTPLIPIRAGLAGERVFVRATYDGLLNAGRPLSKSELEMHLHVVNDIVRMTRFGGISDEDWEAEVARNRKTYDSWAADPARVEAAGKRLADAGGLSPEVVRRFEPLQVILTDDVLRCEVVWDELALWYNLPLWQMTEGAAAAVAAFMNARSDAIVAPLTITPPATAKRTEARVDQRVAFLRVIEAVRLFAHENGGKLPGSLADIKLPLPNDPVSGKPFDYAVKDGVATLSGTNVSPGRAETNRVYELRLRK